jgi:hypothetical protein
VIGDTRKLQLRKLFRRIGAVSRLDQQFPGAREAHAIYQREDNVEMLLKIGGYIGGPRVLDRLVSYFNKAPMSPPRLKELDEAARLNRHGVGFRSAQAGNNSLAGGVLGLAPEEARPSSGA